MQRRTGVISGVGRIRITAQILWDLLRNGTVRWKVCVEGDQEVDINPFYG